jgi:hypothetical protein
LNIRTLRQLNVGEHYPEPGHMQAVRGIFLAYRVGRQPAQTVHQAQSGAALVTQASLNCHGDDIAPA